MSWEKSEIMKEFGKIMVSQDIVKTAGEKPDAVTKNPYAENVKDIKEKRIPHDKDIIEEAHPEAVYIADSKGDGGLVENQNEQHKKLMEIINKMPTGIIAHRYASTISSLIKMAEACDDIDEQATADILTEAAAQLVSMIDKLPFEKAPSK